MATVKSFADVIMDWQKLMAAYAANAESFTAMEPLRLELDGFLNKALDLKKQQEIQIGAKQKTTQDIKTVVKAGLEVARRMRGHAKGALGTDNESLVAFQVAPRRPRGARKATTPPPTGSSPENSASNSAKPSEP